MRITTKPDHGIRLVSDGGIINWTFQLFIDDVDARLNDDLLGPVLKIPDSYEVADVPDPTKYAGAIIYVTDETDGAVPAFSDGTDWRRMTDRAIISA
jgi:hypothetical protein